MLLSIIQVILASTRHSVALIQITGLVFKSEQIFMFPTDINNNKFLSSTDLPALKVIETHPCPNIINLISVLYICQKLLVDVAAVAGDQNFVLP